MKLVLDFDDVFFNAKKFKYLFFTELERRGFTNIEQKYLQDRKENKVFSLYVFLVRVMAETSVSTVDEVYQEIIMTASQCLNEQIADLVRKVGKENCIILTQGESRFQMDKVKSSGAHDLVSQVVVVDTKKGESLKEICSQYSDEEVIFVDDKLEFVNEAIGIDCKNLITVLYDDSGFINLTKELNNCRKTEGVPGLEVRENEVAGRHEPNPHVPKEIALH